MRKTTVRKRLRRDGKPLAVDSLPEERKPQASASIDQHSTTLDALCVPRWDSQAQQWVHGAEHGSISSPSKSKGAAAATTAGPSPGERRPAAQVLVDANRTEERRKRMQAQIKKANAKSEEREDARNLDSVAVAAKDRAANEEEYFMDDGTIEASDCTLDMAAMDTTMNVAIREVAENGFNHARSRQKTQMYRAFNLQVFWALPSLIGGTPATRW